MDNHLKNGYKQRRITVATDCSGIETPLMALDILGIKYRHIFSSESDKNCISFVQRNFQPETLYTDITKRKHVRNISLDLYVAGFPCQAFSSLGAGRGFDDAIKGTIFFNVFDFIRHNHPRVFVLENVRTLKTHNKGETFRIIMNCLQSLKDYTTYVDVLNTQDYGIPQSRNRLYIIGIATSLLKRDFKFPTPMPLKDRTPLTAIVKNKRGLNRGMLSGRDINNYVEVRRRFPDIDFDNENWILNLDVSNIEWFRLGKIGVSPCIITKPRYYITNQQRYITAHEALELQGIPWHMYDFDFDDSILFKFAGNAMSVNVLVALLHSIFTVI